MDGYRLTRDGSLYVAELTADANEPSELKRSLVWTSQAICRQEPFCFLTDARFAPLPTLETRAFFVEFMSAHKTMLREYCLGWAIVTTSRKQNAAYKALSWMIPKSHPMQMFCAVDAAKYWLLQKSK